MTSRDFAYWLQGFFEISKANEITAEQTVMIKNHLNLVFKLGFSLFVLIIGVLFFNQVEKSFMDTV